MINVNIALSAAKKEVNAASMEAKFVASVRMCVSLNYTANITHKKVPCCIQIDLTGTF